ncbi:putative colanic acid biosynthesis acetyltransferase [uncultured Cytophaga sp.]|uniref:putative colanic acid biosynthesis acetyltransferase n=1 Tax=uncultured Cytophaga sp. TaxID=160238 RepID=UPI00263940CF|nr:putative colanic acid biosynthesis acetyltransferase [uncultured Cytophaga sp.]
MHQDLSKFTMPAKFRGKPGWYVQLWWVVQVLLFNPSPQILYGWRRFLLRLFGAKIGRNVILRPSVKITYPWKLTIGDYSWIGDNVVLYTLGEISIGKNTVISQRGYICTGSHDYKQKTFDVYTKPVIIKDECWLATDVFVAPGVTIDKGMVIGARSSVYKDVLGEAGVYTGSPAKFVGAR